MILTEIKDYCFFIQEIKPTQELREEKINDIIS